MMMMLMMLMVLTTITINNIDAGDFDGVKIVQMAEVKRNWGADSVDDDTDGVDCAEERWSALITLLQLSLMARWWC